LTARGSGAAACRLPINYSSSRAKSGHRRLYIDWPKADSHGDSMSGVFVVKVEALEAVGKAPGKPQGAYINVYTTAYPESQARRVALREIAEAGWHCVNVEGVSWYTREDYSGDASGRECLHIALAIIAGLLYLSSTDPTHVAARRLGVS
jgi:hypothetical protein